MNVALRVMAGQQPALDTILYPIPGPTPATFNQWYTSNMTTSSACFASPKPALPAITSYMGQFFTGGTRWRASPSRRDPAPAGSRVKPSTRRQGKDDRLNPGRHR